MFLAFNLSPLYFLFYTGTFVVPGTSIDSLISPIVLESKQASLKIYRTFIIQKLTSTLEAPFLGRHSDPGFIGLSERFPKVLR